MDLLHLHLMLVHFPVVGPIFITGLYLAAMWQRSKELLIAGVLLSVFVAIISVFSYISGEEGEDIAEKIPGTSEILIEEHEEMAVWASRLCHLCFFVSVIFLIKVQSPFH